MNRVLRTFLFGGILLFFPTSSLKADGIQDSLRTLVHWCTGGSFSLSRRTQELELIDSLFARRGKGTVAAKNSFDLPLVKNVPSEVAEWLRAQISLREPGPEGAKSKADIPLLRLNATLANLNTSLERRELSYRELIEQIVRAASSASLSRGSSESETDKLIERESRHIMEYVDRTIERGGVLLPIIRDNLLSREEILRLNFLGIHPLQLISSNKYADFEEMTIISFLKHEASHALRSSHTPDNINLPFAWRKTKKFGQDYQARQVWSDLYWERLDRLPAKQRKQIVDVLFELFHENFGFNPNEPRFVKELLSEPNEFMRLKTELEKRIGRLPEADKTSLQNSLLWIRDHMPK